MLFRIRLAAAATVLVELRGIASFRTLSSLIAPTQNPCVKISVLGVRTSIRRLPFLESNYSPDASHIPLNRYPHSACKAHPDTQLPGIRKQKYILIDRALIGV